MQGMLLIIPPTCDLTVPLLGVYQIAGYARSCNFPISVFDSNIEFCRKIVDYAVNRAKSFQYNTVSDKNIEEATIAAFLSGYPEIYSYDSLLGRFKCCVSYKQYWKLVDYLRACYDIYSLQFSDIRFRIDSFDSVYKWNLWADIEAFIEKYSCSSIMDDLSMIIREQDFNSYDTAGISITFESQLFFSLLICKILRKIRPGINIIIGGGFVNSFIDCEGAIGPLGNYCDYIFAGEGEALVEFLRKDKLSKRSKYITSQDCCVSQLQVQPPYFGSDNLPKQLSPKRIIPLRFSYDCYWGKCKFCSDKETHSCLNKEYDIKRMIDFCIDAASKSQIDGVYFLDSAIRPRDVRRFASEIINAGIRISWGTNLRFENVFDDDDLIAVMKEAGCVFVKFGLESGSQRVLNMMNKGINAVTAASIISKFRKHGILVHVYVMVAYPGEKPEDRQMTSDFLLSPFSHPDNYSCSEFVLYGNSEFAKEHLLMIKTSSIAQIDGWSISRYEEFTDNSIRAFIAEMRRKFDEVYNPHSVLISTGHTIACANLYSDNEKCHKNDKNACGITFSKRILYSSLDGKPCLSWWRRNNGCLYIVGEWAEYLYKILSKGISCQKFNSLSVPKQITSALWNNACLCYCEEKHEEELPFMPISVPEIMHKNHFAYLEWYGKYDAS